MQTLRAENRRDFDDAAGVTVGGTAGVTTGGTAVSAVPSSHLSSKNTGFRCAPLAFAALLAASITLCACATSPTPRIMHAKFPEAAPRGETLDVQVRRDGAFLEVLNTSSRSLDAGTLWLNMRFSTSVDALGPGQSMRIDLREFRDDVGDVFRAGGFFSKEKPDTVVLAQWQTDGQMLGLIAVAEETR